MVTKYYRRTHKCPRVKGGEETHTDRLVLLCAEAGRQQQIELENSAWYIRKKRAINRRKRKDKANEFFRQKRRAREARDTGYERLDLKALDRIHVDNWVPPGVDAEDELVAEARERMKPTPLISTRPGRRKRFATAEEIRDAKERGRDRSVGPTVLLAGSKFFQEVWEDEEPEAFDWCSDGLDLPEGFSASDGGR